MNGKRNGKGKEYYENGNIEFEGEYLNGKRNGKGKEYFNNGKLLFEGEYLNGKRWNGKGFNINFFWNLKVNIRKEQEMEKGKNIIIMDK